MEFLPHISIMVRKHALFAVHVLFLQSNLCPLENAKITTVLQGTGTQINTRTEETLERV